jgi:hypothetical protein
MQDQSAAPETAAQADAASARDKDQLAAKVEAMHVDQAILATPRLAGAICRPA